MDAVTETHWANPMPERASWKGFRRTERTYASLAESLCNKAKVQVRSFAESRSDRRDAIDVKFCSMWHRSGDHALKQCSLSNQSCSRIQIAAMLGLLDGGSLGHPQPTQGFMRRCLSDADK